MLGVRYNLNAPAMRLPFDTNADTDSDTNDEALRP
jgi:hypothetical protein